MQQLTEIKSKWLLIAVDASVRCHQSANSWLPLNIAVSGSGIAEYYTLAQDVWKREDI